MQVRLVALELTRAYLTECDTRAVVGVDISGNLKDKSCKLLLLGLYIALLGLGGAGRWCNLNKAVKQLLHTKVVQGRSEEYGGHFGLAIGLYVELGVNTIHQLQVLAQLGGVLLAYTLVELLAVDVNLYLICYTLLVGCKQVELLFVDIVNALELGTLIDRPREWANLDFEFLLQFVEQVERIATFAVHLIDKDDNGCFAHAAHRHQFAGLSLNTFGTIHYDNG